MSQALIIIDFINEFLHQDGKITAQGMGKFCKEYGTIENLKKLVVHFRKMNKEIIWVHLGFHENYDNCSKISPRFKGVPNLGILKEGTWSVDFLEELQYDPKEKTITKTRVSPFYKTELEEYIKQRNISELIISGIATDLAVSSIVRDAHDRDINTIVISDACGTISLEDHNAALIGIKKLADIMTTDSFLLL